MDLKRLSKIKEKLPFPLSSCHTCKKSAEFNILKVLQTHILSTSLAYCTKVSTLVSYRKQVYKAVYLSFM